MERRLTGSQRRNWWKVEWKKWKGNSVTIGYDRINGVLVEVCTWNLELETWNLTLRFPLDHRKRLLQFVDGRLDLLSLLPPEKIHLAGGSPLAPQFPEFLPRA